MSTIDQPRGKTTAASTTGSFAPKVQSAPEVELTEAEVQEYKPVYIIPRSRLEAFQQRIDRANSRLERSGISERFTFEVEEDEEHDRDTGMVRLLYRITLNKPQISLDGWVFSSAHELTADGQMLNYGPDTLDEMRCDHCGHNRRRGKVFTVRNEETGEVKVIGSNCLAAFLGVRPSGLWALEYELDGDETDDGLDWRSGGGPDTVIPAQSLLVAALAVSNEGTDFVPASKATEKTPATVRLVRQRLSALLEAEHPAERVALADEILSWLNQSEDETNDYMRNLRAVLAGEDRRVGEKHFALAVSAIGAWRRAQEKRVQREQRRQFKGHFGTPGEKFSGVAAEVLNTYSFETYYGYNPTWTTIVTFATPDNKIIKWKTASALPPLQPGQKVRLSGTVKEHGEYRGQDETSVLRAKIEPVEDLEDSKDAEAATPA